LAYSDDNSQVQPEVSDALTICQQEIKQARIDEIRLLQSFLAKDATNIIHPSTLWLRIKELEGEK